MTGVVFFSLTMVPPIVLYIGMCMLVALIGRKRYLGMFAYFVCSLVLSPVIGLLVVFASGPARVPPPKPGKAPKPAKAA